MNITNQFFTPVMVQSRTIASHAGRLMPGIMLCLGVTAVAVVGAWAQRAAFGTVWLEELVLAILLGIVVRALYAPTAAMLVGIRFCAKQMLDVAVMVLGLSISTHMLFGKGVALPLGIALFVVMAIATSYAIGRLFGLPSRMATLIACGNAICGNSAIAAIAPVIHAEGEDVAASISFTAVLGVALVLLLPLSVTLLHMQALQYGALAGLTVYAVPQVLAATAPAGASAVQFGTLIKLTRVFMLGPVVIFLACLVQTTAKNRTDVISASRTSADLPAKTFLLHQCVPWFILGFLGLALMRSMHLVPLIAIQPALQVSSALTVVSMAGLGLSTDLQSLAGCGLRVSITVLLSLLLLLLAGLGLIWILGV
ncbi:UPF0324 membrane protein [Acetobacter cibinongensis]|uniref:UPF0324 membrane protein n=1 Tax=Acetobacter cibinongensis TaxID=146475 RepID=A0A0D6N4V8_9PROT|nr:putative sulfate exporter family transporter [Acetobacter cibinongensis]GAN60546.1 hypothetical protein Abci_012_019 [Acetobacter cibinongensis]GBQ17789.1 hypothetical protein AA0482_2019 [Acetobacter cibinongensis NRIC 0482]GEL59816.1 UPF0324 membrane protein [Acetobacter cibinongensis]